MFMRRFLQGLLVTCLSIGLHFPGPARAGAFAVHPMRLELGGTTRSAALIVRNDDTVTLSFQVRGMEWSQDGSGADHYGDAPDLVYFPRLLVLEPGKEAVIRIGLRQVATAVEKTYRLFVEELPPPPSEARDEGQARIRALVRFGAPVFVKPLQPFARIEIEQPGVQAGQIRWRMHNAGNRHQRFESLRLIGLDGQGSELFSNDPSVHYILAGKARDFQVPMPAAICSRVARLILEFRTDESEARRELPLGPSPCA